MMEDEGSAETVNLEITDLPPLGHRVFGRRFNERQLSAAVHHQFSVATSKSTTHIYEPDAEDKYRSGYVTLTVVDYEAVRNAIAQDPEKKTMVLARSGMSWKCKVCVIPHDVDAVSETLMIPEPSAQQQYVEDRAVDESQVHPDESDEWTLVAKSGWTRERSTAEKRRVQHAVPQLLKRGVLSPAQAVAARDLSYNARFGSRAQVFAIGPEALFQEIHRPWLEKYIKNELGDIVELKLPGASQKKGWCKILFADPKAAKESVGKCLTFNVDGQKLQMRIKETTKLDLAGSTAQDVDLIIQNVRINGIDASKVNFVAINNPVVVGGEIFNRNTKNSILMEKISLGMFPYQNKLNWKKRPKMGTEIRANGKLEIELSFTPEESKKIIMLLRVHLSDNKTSTQKIHINVAENDMIHVDLSEEVKQHANTIWDEQERILIPAFGESRPNPTHVHTDVFTQWEEHLPLYEIPKDLQSQVDKYNRSLNLNPWNVKSEHKNRFHYLLYLEEAVQQKSMRQFDLSSVQFQISMDPELRIPVHEFPVAGLAERRPSVLKNDIVIAWIAGTIDVEYEGIVSSVGKDTVKVYFCEDFEKRTKGNKSFSVRFKWDRLHFRRMHNALDCTDDNLLWPNSKPRLLNPELPTELLWTDNQVESNPDQRQAVADCLNLLGTSNDSERIFLLRGAFGTGKTRTLCEIAYQALAYDMSLAGGDYFRPILICTEANGAADKIIEGLKSNFNESSPKRLFRFNAMHRPRWLVPETVIKYSRFDEARGLFTIPQKCEFMNSYDIIVTTYSNASVLHGLGLKEEFSMILCDESSQALEPMVLNAVALASSKTVVVFAGDDMQISPKVYCEQARHHGLGKSIIHRLVKHYKDHYSGPVRNDCLKSPNGAELRQNFRCHSKILEIASHLFYQEASLTCHADPSFVNVLEQWEDLPTPGIPIVFYDTYGEAEQPPHDASWYNRYEADKVLQVLSSLLASEQRACGNEGKNIAVVSGFRLQNTLIRQKMRGRLKGDTAKVTVGPVETMQGQEKSIVIVSTVRTQSDRAGDDAKHQIGFMLDPPRLNTVITRAASLLVIVGDAIALGTDKTWMKFITWCKTSKVFIPRTPLELRFEPESPNLYPTSSTKGLSTFRDSDAATNTVKPAQPLSESFSTSSDPHQLTPNPVKDTLVLEGKCEHPNQQQLRADSITCTHPQVADPFQSKNTDEDMQNGLNRPLQQGLGSIYHDHRQQNYTSFAQLPSVQECMVPACTISVYGRQHDLVKYDANYAAPFFVCSQEQDGIRVKVCTFGLSCTVTPTVDRGTRIYLQCQTNESIFSQALQNPPNSNIRCSRMIIQPCPNFGPFSIVVSDGDSITLFSQLLLNTF